MSLDPARDEARFWEQTIPEPNSGCLLWTGAVVSTHGYGIFHLGSIKDGTRRNETTNRLACTYAHGPPPSSELQALHRCDVKTCVEPRHVYWGTRKDNGRDASLRGRTGGRSMVGSLNGNAKLTEEQVRTIRLPRLSNVSARVLAGIFGVSETQIYWIRKRKSWSQLP